jgi:membrane carboxypeptidase/penicillin-binding protein
MATSLAPSVRELTARVCAPHKNATRANKDKNGLLKWMTEQLDTTPKSRVHATLARGTGKTTSIAMFAACAALADGGREVSIIVCSEDACVGMAQLVRQTLKQLQGECSPTFEIEEHRGARFMLRGPGTGGSIFVTRNSKVEHQMRGASIHLTLIDEYAFLAPAAATAIEEMSQRVICVGTPFDRAKQE